VTQVCNGKVYMTIGQDGATIRFCGIIDLCHVRWYTRYRNDKGSFDNVN